MYLLVAKNIPSIDAPKLFYQTGELVQSKLEPQFNGATMDTMDSATTSPRDIIFIFTSHRSINVLDMDPTSSIQFMNHKNCQLAEI
jgi:hypothetical protein